MTASVPAPPLGTPFSPLCYTGIKLRALPGDITDAAAQEDFRADSDGLVIRVVQQRRKLPGAAVGNIAQVRFQYPHVSINSFIRKIGGHIIILIGIPDIEQHRLVQVLDVNPGFQFFTRITVCAVSRCLQPDVFTGD